MMTNLLLGVLAAYTRGADSVLPWREPAARWLINLRLVVFLALTIAADAMRHSIRQARRRSLANPSPIGTGEVQNPNKRRAALGAALPTAVERRQSSSRVCLLVSLDRQRRIGLEQNPQVGDQIVNQCA